MSEPPILRASPSAADPEFPKRLLGHVFHLLNESGFSSNRSLALTRTLCRDLPRARGGWDPSRFSLVVDLARLIEAWHCEPDFITSNAEPKPLPLKLHGPKSFSDLVTSVLPHRLPADILSALTRNKALHRRGSTVQPRGRTIQYRDPEDARAHALLVLETILRAFHHNLHSSRPVPEFAATNRRIAVKRLPALYREVRPLAQNHAVSMDNLLWTYAARDGGSEPITEAMYTVLVVDAHTTAVSRNPSRQRGSPARKASHRRAR